MKFFFILSFFFLLFFLHRQLKRLHDLGLYIIPSTLTKAPVPAEEKQPKAWHSSNHASLCTWCFSGDAWCCVHAKLNPVENASGVVHKSCNIIWHLESMRKSGQMLETDWLIWSLSPAASGGSTRFSIKGIPYLVSKFSAVKKLRFSSDVCKLSRDWSLLDPKIGKMLFFF